MTHLNIKINLDDFQKLARGETLEKSFSFTPLTVRLQLEDIDPKEMSTAIDKGLAHKLRIIHGVN